MQTDGTLRAGLVAAGLPELADRLELGPVPYWPTAGFLELTQPGVRVSVARLRHLRQVLRQLHGAVVRVVGRRVRRRRG